MHFAPHVVNFECVMAYRSDSVFASKFTLVPPVGESNIYSFWRLRSQVFLFRVPKIVKVYVPILFQAKTTK